jgi:hypothetical protein
LLKVDFEKTYDCVVGYLQTVMVEKGFPSKWRGWIMNVLAQLDIDIDQWLPYKGI